MNSYFNEVSDAMLTPSFVKVVFRGNGRFEQMTWKEVIIRPVKIKNRLRYQFSFFDDKKDITKNFKEKEAQYYFGKVLRARLTSIVLTLTDKKLQYEIAGREVKRHVHAIETKPDFSHDHKPDEIIPLKEPFLRLTGLTSSGGKIIADKRDKWKQVTEFLNQIEKTCDFSQFDRQIVIKDYGCGNAYLTFCLYYYLKAKKLSVTVIGVDRNQELIESNITHAKEVGFDDLHFKTGDIAENENIPVDIAVALHACDTATDDALIAAVNSGAQYIFVSPCCHHHLQAQKQAVKGDAIVHFPTLKERMVDIITDTARALAVTAWGYNVDVFEFVPDFHTPRNVLIRAVKTTTKKTQEEYNQFIEKWGITPYIEKLFSTK